MREQLKKFMLFIVALCLLVSMFAPTEIHAAGKVALNKTKVILTVGETVKLKIKNAPVADITWSSSKKAVVAVNKNGKVKAKKAGTAMITAKVDNKSYTCTVMVNKKAIQPQDADTYYETGRACLYGLNGQKIDLKAAYTNFEKALKLGKTEANFYLGILYHWYMYPEEDYEKAKAYYEAAGDDPGAQLALGFLYRSGRGVEKDEAKAQELFEAVIEKGYVEGYYGCGVIANYNGEYVAAFEFFNKVLEGNEQLYIAAAMSNIGAMYGRGSGVEQDDSKAAEWYLKAANLGDTAAMNNIGFMYWQGKGVMQDDSEAMEWFEKAANLRDSSAMNNLGSMYYDNRDYSKAMEWYLKAADLGNTSAMHNIGFMYEHGDGVEQDLKKAQEWYDRAAVT